MRVVVCGGGVIGASTAYFLSRRGADVVVVERTGVANASSGKAGAFLALDWSRGSPLDALSRRSFALHAQLAEELDDDWGFHRVATYGAYAAPGYGGRRGSDGGSGAPGREWLSDSVTLTSRLGSPETTAMVHPRKFTEAMIRAAQGLGAELRIGQVTGVVYAGDGSAGGGDSAGHGGSAGRESSAVRGVEVDGGRAVDGGSVIEADAVVIAMGPWSVVATGWLPLPVVMPYKGHSLVFETGSSVPPEAVFFEYQEPGGAALTPELFPRSDGTTYVAMSSAQDRLPFDPADVRTDAPAIEQLESICERVSPALARSKIIARQACYRPVTQDGLPLIGQVPGIAGAFVATGHSVWGVLNAPATGEALAELIVDGAARSTNLRPFDPARLRPTYPGGAR
jgi:glycine/D-amino acid oxidase-like deaminating enzyme